MPKPTVEQLRKAVEDSIRQGLEEQGQHGEWIANLENGEEVQFRPGQNGLIDVTVYDGETEEETVVAFQVYLKPVVS